ILARRVNETVTEETFEQILRFAEGRFRDLVNAENFESKVRGFVGERLDDLTRTNSTPAKMFTAETVSVIKDRIDQQVEPIAHHLAELATSKNTRMQIGGLIKREVDDYYQHLSFFKKIFISRERIYREVDDLVHATLPRRVEEYL